MDKSVSAQVIAALAEQTRLKPEEGLLLALYPDFILVVRPGMNAAERNAAADALLEAAEGLSLPVLEDPADDGKDGYEDENSLYIPPDMLEEAGFLGLDYDEDLIYTVEDGRIIIEMEDQ